MNVGGRYVITTLFVSLYADRRARRSWGFIMVGMMLNLILYGFMFMQCYIYLSAFKK